MIEPQELYIKDRTNSVSDSFDLADAQEVRRLLVVLNSCGQDFVRFGIDAEELRVELRFLPGGAQALMKEKS